MTDGEGCPVAVEVYPGNTGDPTTVGDQMEKLRQRFGLAAGGAGGRSRHADPAADRQAQAASRHGLDHRADEQGDSQTWWRRGPCNSPCWTRRIWPRSRAPDYPGERLVVCHNPVLEEERGAQAAGVAGSYGEEFEKIAKEVARRKKKPLTAAEIGLKVGKVLGRYKVGKHFECTIGEGSFTWSRRAESIEQEEKLDGIYVLRTSEPRRAAFGGRHGAQLQEPGGSRAGFSLSERDRSVGATDSASQRGSGARRIFSLCVLAYYVEWHLRRAWAPLLFEDEERREERKRRDPILPAKPSASAEAKKCSHQTADGLPVHSFASLLAELASRARVTYAIKSEKAEEKTNSTFRQVPEPTPLQARAYELVRTFPVTGK